MTSEIRFIRKAHIALIILRNIVYNFGCNFMYDCYLSLGSNLGERKSYIETAIEMLRALPRTAVTKKSSLYETSPVGMKTQNSFLNCVVKLSTVLSAIQLLEEIKKIEYYLGRRDRNEIKEKLPEDRTIDIDIIMYGKYTVVSAELVVPHPRAKERLFVLIPMGEIAPGIKLEGKAIEEWIEEVKRNNPEQEVQRVDSAGG